MKCLICIENILPFNMCNSFFRRQEIDFNRIWIKEQEKINNKIRNLRASRRIKERTKIKNIRYNIMHSMNFEMNCDTLNTSWMLQKISTKEITANERQITHNINICPETFNTNFEII